MTADVVVVGGGPSGLAAAQALRAAGAGHVVVLERESETGGIPRHADHQGYGLRDLHRVMSGPAYARRRTALADAAGVELRTGVQVTGWADATARGAAAGGGGLALELTSGGGRETLAARAVVLATGCRERPRSARWVPGTRPQGVMTTGTLQQLVHLAGARPGRRAVVVGAEHVSYSALLTLDHAGARAVAMTTELRGHQTFAAFDLGARLRYRTPLVTGTRVTDIVGRRRVEGVVVTDLDGGGSRTIDCDLVVFTADWIPDHELAVLGGVALDPGARGPAVDAAGHTTRPGVFAVGNLRRGAETADVAALEGRAVAPAVLDFLGGAAWPARVPIHVAEPLHWVTPNRVGPAAPRWLALRTREPLHDAAVVAVQDGRELARHRLPRVLPGRSVRLRAGWPADPAAGPVELHVLRARRRT